MPKLKVLLLTNNDSDNVGDQIIEASVISLLKGVMLNLGLGTDQYTISSRAAGIISKKYMQTKDPALLADARKLISGSDLLIFGGAPLFNYAYQNFYLKTITTLELAEEYGVPVLFSSIGVEKYDVKNAKSQRLKKALQLPVVRQITTRDDLESVQRYTEETGIPVAHVADPAVFADLVFRKPKAGTPAAPEKRPAVAALVSHPSPSALLAAAKQAAPPHLKALVKQVRRGEIPSPRALFRPASPAAPTASSSPSPARPKAPAAAKPPKKSGRRIGLVVTRDAIFRDNGIDFTEEEQQELWLDIIERLSARGDDYKLFTTGHFSDEVFLDNLVRTRGVPAGKVSFTINSPEELIAQLSACDGVIAYRLHASITSFALSIPSVGLSWNFKVPYFYDSVGCGDRAIAPENWNAEHVLAQLDRAMREGVPKDHQELMGVYETLFEGVKGVVAPQSSRTPFTYKELAENLPPYGGTSHKQYKEKVRRKMRRSYDSYKKKDVALAATRETLAEEREQRAAEGESRAEDGRQAP
ncbi:polysaccharide pyruvyl transferase family protein [Brachybacterium aquaticum]|uniref:Polysaccharide pyruvyl transferase WcaK-like protein n=1 Tax=Brachybacterium aquaticum TaxID=1432564 RepID=A0A841A696_9MICO|nr:polysaccharide pyruvyl transferase family protein [Brachybacterium aquaticum]MBB5830376.1 polysaccharide pyruvyl transferase WcaK-like protein [Brachybacterium aquaticum]